MMVVNSSQSLDKLLATKSENGNKLKSSPILYGTTQANDFELWSFTKQALEPFFPKQLGLEETWLSGW